MRNLLIVAAFLTFSVALLAQDRLNCDDRMTTVRISEIKTGGSAAGFLGAVAAHKAWYVSKGFASEEIYAVPVIIRGLSKRAQSYSDKQFMTFHIHGTKGAGPQRDAGYEAFVKLYRDNSDIKSEYNVCLPNPAATGGSVLKVE